MVAGNSLGKLFSFAVTVVLAQMIIEEIRYDTRCYFNVRSKADISRLNLPHGNDVHIGRCNGGWTEINGESTSVVWPTLASRTAKEQNRMVGELTGRWQKGTSAENYNK